MFAPPALQAPTPTPRAELPRPATVPNPVVGQTVITAPRYAPYVDNMGALAQSLANFSKYFDDFSKSMTLLDQKKDAAAKSAGASLAAGAQQYGGFTSLQELQKTLEKRVAENAPGAEDMLRRFQAADPRTLRYATINLQDAVLKNNLATLNERVSQTKTLLDGTPVNEVPANDQRFQQMMSALAMPQGATGILPEVWQVNQQQMSAIYGSISANQEKRYGQYKTTKAQQATEAQIDANVNNLLTGTTPVEQVSGNLSLLLNDFYNQSGQTTEEYQKYKANLPKLLVASALAWSNGDMAKISKAAQLLPDALARVAAGPNGESLLDQIGGVRAIDGMLQNLLKDTSGRRELTDRFKQYEGQDQADADAQAMLTPAVIGDPASLKVAGETLRQQAAQRFPNNPEKQLAYMSRVDKLLSGYDKAYIQPVQDENAAREYSRLAMDPNSGTKQDIGRLTQMFRNKELSESDYRSLIGTIGSRNREDNKANYQVLRGLQNDLKSRLETQYKIAGSDGDANYTAQEARDLAIAMGTFYRRGDEMIRKNPGVDLSRQLGDMYATAVEQSVRKPKDKAFAADSPARLLQGTPSSRAGNLQLRRQAESKALYPQEQLLQQLNRVDAGTELDPATKQIIKRSGMKPSEYFRKQMQNHGLRLDTTIERKLEELDNSDLVSRAPGVSGDGLAVMPTSYVDVAQRMGQRWASAIQRGVLAPINTALVPPAAAGEMPLATVGPARLGSTNLIGVIRSLQGANQFRGVSLIKNKRPGDYQSHPQENWFFDFNPAVVPLAVKRARQLSAQDINALAFTALTEAGPTLRGKLEVAANLINRSAIAGNKPIVDIAKAPGQYEGVFGYTRQQVISAAEGRRIFGRRYDQLRNLLQQGS